MNQSTGIALVCLVALISACTTTKRFRNSNPFASESLELRSDGTFAYASRSDEIGNECFASGTWSNTSMNGVTYVALEVESYERGELDICDRAGIKKHGLWLITHGGIVKVSGEVIERRR